MSIQAFAWAIEQEIRPPGQKLTLIVCANGADCEWTSLINLEHAAATVGCSKKCLQGYLDALSSSGFISCSEGMMTSGCRTVRLLRKKNAPQGQPAEDRASGSKSKKPRATASNPPIPQELQTDEFVEMYKTYLSWRGNERHAAVTPTSAKMMLNQFKNLGPSKSIELMQIGISNGWQGLRASWLRDDRRGGRNDGENERRDLEIPDVDEDDPRIQDAFGPEEDQ